jgi:hypothetical protein
VVLRSGSGSGSLIYFLVLSSGGLRLSEEICPDNLDVLKVSARLNGELKALVIRPWFEGVFGNLTSKSSSRSETCIRM